MKFVLILTMLFGSFNLFANSDLKPFNSECQIVFVVEEVAYYNSRWEAQDFCNKIQGNYNFRDRCFVRQLGSNFWEGNFTHRGVFTGGGFDSIFDQYQNYVRNSDIFRRDSFNHRSRIFNCSNNGY